MTIWMTITKARPTGSKIELEQSGPSNIPRKDPTAIAIKICFIGEIFTIYKTI